MHEALVQKNPVVGAAKTDGLSLALPVNAFFVAVSGMITLWMQGGQVDDSYIYLRVADSILAGDGWAFNPGERANPCTGPLYVLVLMFFRLLGFTGDASLSIAYFLGLSSTCFLLLLALRERSLVFKLSACLLFLTSLTVVLSMGMETQLFIAAMVLCAYCLEHRHKRMLGVSLAMLFLLRPDGALMVGVVVLLSFARDRKLPIYSLVVSALCVLPWLVFSYLYFGSLLPHSVKIKAIQSQIGFWALAPTYFDNFISKANLPQLTLVLLLFGGLGLIHELKRNRYFSTCLALFILAQVLAYSLFQAPVGYFWYNAPAYFVINFVVLHGLFFISYKFPAIRSFFGSLSKQPFGFVSRTCFALVLAVLVGEVGSQPLRFGDLAAEERCSILAAQPITEVHRRYRCGKEYREAGEWIARRTYANAKVAAVEIGYLGFYSQREIVDIHGLLHPEAYDAIRNERSDWWLFDRTPEVVVVHDLQWPGEPMPLKKWFPARAWLHFVQSYGLAEKFGNIHVYVRNDYSLRTATSSS
jgi:hypothetical protein